MCTKCNGRRCATRAQQDEIVVLSRTPILEGLGLLRPHYLGPHLSLFLGRNVWVLEGVNGIAYVQRPLRAIRQMTHTFSTDAVLVVGVPSPISSRCTKKTRNVPQLTVVFYNGNPSSALH